MLKLLFSIFLLLSSLTFGNGGYVIDEYNVDVSISEKNIYSFSENILVNFLEKRRGIYRTVPVVYNGQNIPVYNIKTNAPSTYFEKNKQVVIRIGEENKYIVGEQGYKITFTQNMGNDLNNKYDEVYLNIIGNDWDTIIKKVNFRIELPKSFDASNLNFTTGKKGSRDNSGIVWAVKDNIISGYSTKKLKPYEGLTIALVLKNGYFNVEKANFEQILKSKLYNFMLSQFSYLIYPIISLLILLYFLTKKIKKTNKNKIVETVEFYPPDDLTPSEIGYIIDEKINSYDVTSMIYYWANKGYIEIDGIEENDIHLIQVKTPIFTKKFESFLFENLFKKFTFVNSKNEKVVRIKMLNKKFSNYIYETANYLDEDFSKEIFDGKSMKSFRSFNTFRFILILLYLISAFTLSSIFLKNYIISAVIGILILVSITSLKILNLKKSAYGFELLGRVRGFKQFLKVAEKNKLEKLLNENPNYFYDVLPYAIVLGVTKIWINKFKDLIIESPNWSRDKNNFNSSIFLARINNIENAMHKNLTSVPPSSNRGGGFSSLSGGSSGGGRSGGGGGSW